MLTFLPFARAVKPLPRSLAICAVMFGTGCISQTASRVSEGPPTGLLRGTAGASPDSGARSPSARALTASDAGPTTPALPGLVAPPTPPAITLELEQPYPIDARPRSSNALQAAAEDEALARWNSGGSSDPSYLSSQASFHPGTRVVVDTQLAKIRPGATTRPVPKHGLTPERVQAQARAHGYWPFRLCFEAGQREKKGLGGETRVAFTVNLRGKVSRAALLDSKLENPSTAACLVKAMAHLEFTPHPQRALGMVASIRVWPGDVDLSSAASPAPTLTIGTGFDADSVRARVASMLPELTACFAEARRTDPALWGRLALAAILEVDGTVHQISEVESHFPNAAASHCVQVLLAGLTFPSVNGKPFTVVLPLRLSPEGTQQATGPESNPGPASLSDAGDDPGGPTDTAGD